VRHCTRFPKETFSYDLHVWGTPPAFTLSQDQTLKLKFNLLLLHDFPKLSMGTIKLKLLDLVIHRKWASIPCSSMLLECQNPLWLDHNSYLVTSTLNQISFGSNCTFTRSCLIVTQTTNRVRFLRDACFVTAPLGVQQLDARKKTSRPSFWLFWIFALFFRL